MIYLLLSDLQILVPVLDVVLLVSILLVLALDLLVKCWQYNINSNINSNYRKKFS